MAKDVTKPITDVGPHTNTNTTKVMTKSAETEIKLTGEFLEYVPEYTYTGQLISFRDN